MQRSAYSLLPQFTTAFFATNRIITRRPDCRRRARHGSRRYGMDYSYTPHRPEIPEWIASIQLSRRKAAWGGPTHGGQRQYRRVKRVADMWLQVVRASTLVGCPEGLCADGARLSCAARRSLGHGPRWPGCDARPRLSGISPLQGR